MTTQSLGASKFTISADASQFSAVIKQAKGQLSDFSSAAVKDYNALNAQEKRRVDSLIRQANTLGKTRQEQIMYNAALRGTPTSILKELEGQLTKNTQETVKYADSQNRLGEAIGKSIAGLTVFGGALGVAGMYRFISLTKQAEQEQLQLQAVLRSTGHGAGWTQEQLNNMAQSLSSTGGKSIFSSNEITEAQTKLLSFTNIVGEQVPKAMQAIADMATREKMSIESAAETVGRALDIPSQGLTALTRQGFKFDAAVKQQIETLERQGKVGEAQQVILDAMAESYDGAAEAARNSFGGALKSLQHTIDDLLTGNSGSMESMRESVEGLTDQLSSQETKDAFASIVVGFTNIANAAINAVTQGVNFSKWLTELTFGASDPVGQMREQIEKLDVVIANNQRNIEMASRNGGYTGKYREQLEDAIAKREALERDIADYNNMLNDHRNASAVVAPTPALTPTTPAISQKSGSGRGGSKGSSVDPATRLLEQIQQKHAELTAQQMSDAGKLLSSEKELLKFEERIAAIKSRDIITAEERSLLINQQRIQDALELNLVAERALDQRRAQIKLEQDAFKEATNFSAQANAIYAQANNKRDQTLKQNQDELAAFGLGKQALSRVQEQRAIIESFQDMFDDLEASAAKAMEAASLAGLDFDSTEYDKARAFLNEQLELRLQDLKDHNLKVDEMQSSYTMGLTSGLADFADEAKNTYKQIADVVKSALDETADALTDFTMTGKADFKGLADSIIKDLIRMQYQKMLTGIFGDGSEGSGLGGLIGGLFSGTTGGKTNVKKNALGGVYDSPSLSQYSGQVVSNPTMFAFAKGAGLMGEAGPEAIMPLERTSDGSLGVKAIGGGKDGTNVSIVINADGSASTSGGGADKGAFEALAQGMETYVRKFIQDETRQGGMLWQSNNGRL